jgi:Kdo2-lipid IVA lauroyltransferase/acyltransferase
LLISLLFKAVLFFVRFIYWTRFNNILEFYIYIFLHYIIRYRKQVIQKNLLIIYPTENQKLIIEKTKKYHRYLAKLILESIWAFGANLQEIYPKVKFKNLELFEEIYQKGDNATILISHIGNWELFCQWAALYIPKLKVNILYTPLKNKTIDSIMVMLRQRFGARLISTKSTLDLFRIQKEDSVAINLFAIDQNPGNPYHQHWLPFFGREVPVISGAEKFAKSQCQKVYFLYVTKNINYELELIELNFDPNVEFNLTQQQFQILEKNIIENPCLWLLSHNRFKYEK